MRKVPTAFGIVAPDSDAHKWHWAQIHRLAKHLGYAVIWQPDDSVIPLADQARKADVDIAIVASPDHLGPLELNSLMAVVDVESVVPRLTFSRWADTHAGRMG
ncbi:hypothetical protein [Nocardia jiangxiensis]|uniref:hypothetical protein n=1 Tax=Nocardia jiangxiensis TaxID=282685 RepID=UPI0005925AAB|nr:hypothetical protein [Nocardia jiangxiensis]